MEWSLPLLGLKALGLVVEGGCQAQNILNATRIPAELHLRPRVNELSLSRCPKQVHRNIAATTRACCCVPCLAVSLGGMSGGCCSIINLNYTGPEHRGGCGGDGIMARARHDGAQHCLVCSPNPLRELHAAGRTGAKPQHCSALVQISIMNAWLQCW